MQAEGVQLVETIGIATSYAMEFTTHTCRQVSEERQERQETRWENFDWPGDSKIGRLLGRVDITQVKTHGTLSIGYNPFLYS